MKAQPFYDAYLICKSKGPPGEYVLTFCDQAITQMPEARIVYQRAKLIRFSMRFFPKQADNMPAKEIADAFLSKLFENLKKRGYTKDALAR